MRKLMKKDGFTLIELMIVVVIIGILAAIAIPKFSQVSNNAKQSEAIPILKQICTLQDTYIQGHGGPATALTSLDGWATPTAKYYQFSVDATSGDPSATLKTGVTDKLATFKMICSTGAVDTTAAV